MNFYTKIALGLLGVGVVVGAWYADEHYTKKEQDEKTASAKVLNFETEKVRKVSLRSAGASYAFERKDAVSEWSMTEPAGALKPDQDAVANLVSAVQSLGVETTLAGTEKAAKEGAEESTAFGLKEPRAQIEVVLDGGATHKIAIGGDVGIGSESGSTFNALSVYAQASGRDKVLVVGSSVVGATKKTLADFRTKIAGDFKTADAKGISVKKTGSPAIELVKGDKDWSITAPGTLQADNNNVGLFLDRWSRLRVEKVTEKDAATDAAKAALGLTTPAAVIEVRGTDGKVLQTFEVGLTKEFVNVTMADGAVGSLDLGQFADLVPELKYFRDRRVLRDVTMADVVKLRTASGKEFQKEGSNWYPVGEQTPQNTDAKGTPVAASGEKASNKDAYDVFSQWEFLVADDIVDNPSGNLAEYGLASPISRFVFSFKEGGPGSVEVVIGNRVPKNEKLVYVKRADKPEVYAVETQWLDALARLDGAVAGKDPQAKK